MERGPEPRACATADGAGGVEFRCVCSHLLARRGRLRLVLVLVSTGLALGAAEVVLRARNPLGFRMRGNTLVLPAGQVYDIRADDRSRSDQLDPHVVHF